MENTKMFPLGKPQVKEKDHGARNWDGLIFLWLALLTASVIYLRPTGETQNFAQAISALESEISEVRQVAGYAENGVVEQENKNSEIESRIDDVESEIENIKSDLNLL